MFACEECKRVTEPKEKCHRTVIVTRPKKYQNDRKITYGSEIVKEADLCEGCAVKHNSKDDED